MILFSDPEKQKKLEEAIRLGFIIRQEGQDGVYTYVITNHGMHQWMTEKMFGAVRT